MMRGGKILGCVFAGFLLSSGVKALVSDSAASPYQKIVERNLFNLKAPPAPGSNLPPPPPPPTVTLTSITTILGKKLVTMTVPGKPGQPVQNLMLAEGQGQEGIEVLQIDETAGTVQVKNQGIEQTLDFLKNGAKPMPGMTPTFLIPPPITPQPNASPGKIQLPARNVRIPSATEQNPTP